MVSTLLFIFIGITWVALGIYLRFWATNQDKTTQSSYKGETVQFVDTLLKISAFALVIAVTTGGLLITFSYQLDPSKAFESFKLDGQSFGGLLSFALTLPIALAGSLVVIALAKKQNELAQKEVDRDERIDEHEAATAIRSLRISYGKVIQQLEEISQFFNIVATKKTLSAHQSLEDIKSSNREKFSINLNGEVWQDEPRSVFEKLKRAAAHQPYQNWATEKLKSEYENILEAISTSEFNTQNRVNDARSRLPDAIIGLKDSIKILLNSFDMINDSYKASSNWIELTRNRLSAINMEIFELPTHINTLIDDFKKRGKDFTSGDIKLLKDLINPDSLNIASLLKRFLISIESMDKEKLREIEETLLDNWLARNNPDDHDSTQDNNVAALDVIETITLSLSLPWRSSVEYEEHIGAEVINHTFAYNTLAVFLAIIGLLINEKDEKGHPDKENQVIPEASIWVSCYMQPEIMLKHSVHYFQDEDSNYTKIGKVKDELALRNRKPDIEK